MQPMTTLKAALLILALPACVPTIVAEPPAADSCGAAGYQGLIGQSLAATTLPDTLDFRIVGDGRVATTDYRPDRLNLWVGPDGRIERAYCG